MSILTGESPAPPVSGDVIIHVTGLDQSEFGRVHFSLA
jgi:hypothetical protein